MTLRDDYEHWARSFPRRMGEGWGVFLDAISGLVDTVDYSVVSGNDADTDVTAAELEELTDGSETTLHSHADPALDYADISGNDAGTDVTAAELEELTDGSETSLHSHAGGDSWTYVYLAAPFATTLAADTAVTNFYFTPAAGKLYVVEGNFLLRTATATVGARPGCSWPSGLSDGAAWVTAPNSATAAANRFIPAGTTQNAASTGLADTANSHLGTLWATFITGGSPTGNFQVTLRTETAGTAVTMRTGSWIRYRTVI